MKIAFLFPGQGAQFVGMGKDLYETNPRARQVFDEADKTLRFSLSRLCFQGPFEELTKTENCQSAVLVTSLAFYEALRAAYPDLKPSYAAGLSLGEYSALVAAGIVSFRDAVHLVRKRGEFMEAAAKKNPGKMSCVLGLDVQVVQEICQDTGGEVANLNCPGQVVVSGTNAQLDAVSAKATEQGAKRVFPLDVSGAFHSSLMNEAADKLRSEIDRVKFNRAKVPLICNVDASEQTDPEVIKHNLIKQVNSATYWEASMRYLLTKRIDVFFEIGPGSVLKGLFRKIDANAKVLTVGKASEIEVLRTVLA